jgi:TatD DNase family protein
MQLIDSHVHINFETFATDLDAVAFAWRQAGVVHLVHSCVTPDEFQSIQAIADRFPEVSFAVGLHPLDVSYGYEGLKQQLVELASSDRRVVAIGETGLDFFKADNQEAQMAAFWAQLEVAHQLDLPVIIHCRDAAATTANLLREFWQQHGPVSGVMHCWAGSPEETRWFLDLGFYISFSGIVTFKNAHQVQATAQMVPQNRILAETDCPFLTPVPKRKERRNQPANVEHVVKCLASLRGQSMEELASQTTNNAVQLFNLPVKLRPALTASVG